MEINLIRLLGLLSVNAAIIALATADLLVVVRLKINDFNTTVVSKFKLFIDNYCRESFDS